MEKSLFEQIGGTYHRAGDYFLPDLSVPELPAIGTPLASLRLLV